MTNTTGLSEKDTDKIKSVLAGHPEIGKAILYGSRAKGNYKPASDIDITLVGENLDLNMLQLIEEQLEDLLLPYKFDISILHQIKNPGLLDHIERVGLVFWER